MKKAVIDQIMVWMLVFVSFVTLFYLSMDYYKLLKTKESCDTMSNYGARMKALGKSNDTIAGELNKRKSNLMDTINATDIICREDITDQKYQVVFRIMMDLNTTTFQDKQIQSVSSAFNELTSSNIECNLTITTN